MPKIKKVQEKTKKSLEKLRNFAFILYPETANENWRQILADLSQPVFWVLHDKDLVVDNETGEVTPKKPHIHVMIMFENQRLVTAVAKIAEMCGASGYVEKIDSKKAYARYLCHLDHPNKHRYSYEEVQSLNGAEYNKIACTNKEIELQMDNELTEIINYCQENNIFAYCKLIDYCVKNRKEWLKILRNVGSGNLIREYIKSHYWYNKTYSE